MACDGRSNGGKGKSTGDGNMNALVAGGNNTDNTDMTPTHAFGLDLVTRQFKRMSRRVRKVRSCFLQFGMGDDQRIAVDLYAPFARAKKPKATKVHARDMSTVHCETVFVSTAVGAYVPPEAITSKCVDIGGVRVVVTPDELVRVLGAFLNHDTPFVFDRRVWRA